ncbi:hypothetical protein [Brevifollis gellanilyticus]|uniref:Uncharacterized protein n=1 Tax=Brevifollis gellanilyticus TaxID=748831 RepID=A0A512M6H7_9BACT|nr:hypothetical protein [Brevifollis gellanilyticus]GEP42337.1 hypothetical protein BGE01nite_16280 [Brevifollis gellanilyticus]
MTANSLIAAAASLQRLEGVAGVILFKGRNTVHKQMPFSDGRALDLQETISQMVDGYRQVRRKMRQLYLEFDGGTLLIIIQDESVLVMLLTARADADLVASAASVLMSDHALMLTQLPSDTPTTPAKTSDGIEELVVTSPLRIQEMNEKAEPLVNNWGQVRKVVESLLGKVMGRAQVGNLIDRTLEKRSTPDPYRLPVSEVRKLAISLIEYVPNTAKRQALLSELEPQLSELLP